MVLEVDPNGTMYAYCSDCGTGFAITLDGLSFHMGS